MVCMSTKPKILIVEDEIPLALLMVDALSRVGCDVEIATTGKKGMELAKEMPFDLITLDIGLPDACGFDLCTELKERHISRHTPVVFISAKPCEADLREGMKRGAVDYITKPFDVTDFIYRVISHTKAKASQTPAAT
jgi:DNA-binding response OmpR family regulator